MDSTSEVVIAHVKGHFKITGKIPEYIYLPNHDGEYSIWVASDALDALRRNDLKEFEFEDAAPAELVVAMDFANHGQDLIADFISEAVELIKGEITATDWSKAKVTWSELVDWQKVADTVRKHNAPSYKGACGSPNLCEADERIYDLSMYSVEPILSDYGFVVEWDDGVRVYKVRKDL